MVVGAHAVYLRTGDAGIAIAPFTTDADLALEPAILEERPELERLLCDAGFERDANQPGAWVTSTTINGEQVPGPVDLMVPDAAAPKGSRRAVDLPGLDRMATRRATGLEAVLIEHDLSILARAGLYRHVTSDRAALAKTGADRSDYLAENGACFSGLVVRLDEWCG